MGTAKHVQVGDLYLVEVDRQGFRPFIGKVIDVEQTFTRWGNERTIMQVEREGDGKHIEVAPRHLIRKLETAEDLLGARGEILEFK
jgi:hypothetical protein